MAKAGLDLAKSSRQKKDAEWQQRVMTDVQKNKLGASSGSEHRVSDLHRQAVSDATSAVNAAKSSLKKEAPGAQTLQAVVDRVKKASTEEKRKLGTAAVLVGAGLVAKKAHEAGAENRRMKRQAAYNAKAMYKLHKKEKAEELKAAAKAAKKQQKAEAKAAAKAAKTADAEGDD